MNTNPSEMDPLMYEYTYNYKHTYPNPYSLETEQIPQPILPNYHQNVATTIPSKLHTLETHASQNYMNLETKSCNTIQNLPANTVINYAGNTTNDLDTNIPKVEDSKEDIKPLIKTRKKSTKKTSNSNYFSKKITEPDFPFFGCTICNVSYTTIQELDKHVIVHKGRLTSYDLRLKNQKKRKMLKKQKKLLKKSKCKIKQENVNLNVEIKPEEGYIGNEKVSDYTENNENLQTNSDNVQNRTDNDMKNKDVGIKNATTKDPRLEKLFKCFACQKQFSLGYYLRLHVRSHTDEKPYTCQECGQSFITASKLGRHKKRIHLAIKYQCRICYRMFGRFDHLTRHFDLKHPDDKLEGEPYDFNAILPYLKELEENLKEVTGQVKEESEDHSAKEESGDQSAKEEPGDQSAKEESGDQSAKEISHENEIFDSWPEMPDNEPDIKPEEPENVIINETIYNENDIEIKLEPEDDIKPVQDCIENDSDDDYFPADTWTSAQEPEDTPQAQETLETQDSPPKQGKKKKLKNKDKNPVKCEICEKIIKHSYMKIHLRTHTGEKPYKCYVCDKGFITSGKMARHILTHGDDLDQGGDVKLENEIKKEEDNIDGDKMEVKRQRVRKRKARVTNVTKCPLPKGQRRRPYECSFCNKKYLHEESLQAHMKSHDGQEKVFKCTYCLLIIFNEDELRSHEETHSGPKPYLCLDCGRSYTKKETMIYHKKLHDPKAERKEFICDICSKSFNAACKLQRHILSHTSERYVLRYECPVCAHMFHTKYHIQMHLQTHQKEGLILEENRNEILAMVLQNARKIPQKGDKPANLSDIIPSDERSRVCNICGQVFQHFYYLEEHLKSHGSKISIENENSEEVKKHICKVCNKGFKLHYYLKLHSFTHTKEKPFICQQCGKGFITRGKLKRHLETHSGLKKFQCHICYKFFTRTSYLRIHVRTIHGTQDYNFKMAQFDSPFSENSV